MVTDVNFHHVDTDAGAEVSLRADQLYMEAKRYRAQYPEGTRIVLQHMNDPHHPVPPGTKGTIRLVDDGCNIHVDWDNGRTLCLIPQVDRFRLLTEDEIFEETRLKEFVDHIGITMKPSHAPQTFILPDLEHGVQVWPEKKDDTGYCNYKVAPCLFDYGSAKVTLIQPGNLAVYGDRADLLKVCRRVIALHLPSWADEESKLR